MPSYHSARSIREEAEVRKCEEGNQEAERHPQEGSILCEPHSEEAAQAEEEVRACDSRRIPELSAQEGEGSHGIPLEE